VHIARIPDEADTKKIITASPFDNCRRPLGRPRITWLKTIQQDLKSKHLSLNAIDMAPSTLEIDDCIWNYALLVVHARKEGVYFGNTKSVSDILISYFLVFFVDCAWQ